MNFDNIIIGAGISGISTLHYLNKLQPDSKNLLIEKSSKIGGNIRSFTYNGKTFDYGSLELFDNYYVFDDMIKDYNPEYSVNRSLIKKVHNSHITIGDYINIFGILVNKGFKSYYDIDYSECKNDSCLMFRPNSYWNNYVYSYTYGECQNMYDCIIYPNIIWMEMKMKQNERIVEGSLQKLMERIVIDICSNTNNKLITDTVVTSITKNTNAMNNVTTSRGVFSTKNIILACPVNNLHSSILGIDTNNLYTHYYVVIIKTSLIDLDWNVYLEQVPKVRTEKHITTYARLPEIDPAILFVFVRSENINKEADTDISSFVKENTRFGKDGDILFIDFFPMSMPSIPLSILNTLKSNNGKDGIWFAGQYLGFPSLETGAYTGYKAALNITNLKYHYLINELKHIETKVKIRFYFIISMIFIIPILCFLLLVYFLRFA